MAKLEDDFKKPLLPISPAQHDEVEERMDRLSAKVDIIKMKSTIEESFEGEEGMLEICKAQYAQAKKGSLPHAIWIANHLTGQEQGEEIKEFRIIEEIIE